MRTLTKNKYLIILIIIVILLTIIKLVSSRSSILPTNSNPTQPGQLAPKKTNQNFISPPNTSSSDTSTSDSNSHSNPQPLPPDRITEVNYQIPLAKFLPYQGKYFRAQRYIGANNLEIIVSREDQTDLAKQEAQAWLTQNGVDQLDRITVTYR